MCHRTRIERASATFKELLTEELDEGGRSTVKLPGPRQNRLFKAVRQVEVDSFTSASTHPDAPPLERGVGPGWREPVGWKYLAPINRAACKIARIPRSQSLSTNRSLSALGDRNTFRAPISWPSFRCAAYKSISFCKFNHRSGVVLITRASLSAISAVTALFPFTI